MVSAIRCKLASNDGRFESCILPFPPSWYTSARKGLCSDQSANSGGYRPNAVSKLSIFPRHSPQAAGTPTRIFARSNIPMQITNTADSQIQAGAGAPETGESPYMPLLLEKIGNFLLRCSSQMRNGHQSGQSYSSQIHNSQTGDCLLVSASPHTSAPSPSQTPATGEFPGNRTGEGQSDSDVVESPNGTSIIGVRVVDGKPQIVWGFDLRNLPWA